MENEKELICEVQEAWLITWEFHSSDENKRLKQLGINNKIIDVLDSRKKFSYVLEHTKKIYIILNGENYDKICLTKREKLKITEKEFFDYNLLKTSYQTPLYKQLSENKDIKSKKYKELIEKFEEYISVGNNPSIYARKVKNLKIYKDEDGKESIEWEEKGVNGKWMKKNYEK